MYCAKCGTDAGEEKTCPSCGAPVGEAVSPPPSPEIQTPKNNKKGCLTVGFIILGVVVLLAIIGAIFGDDEPSEPVSGTPVVTTAALSEAEAATEVSATAAPVVTTEAPAKQTEAAPETNPPAKTTPAATAAPAVNPPAKTAAPVTEPPAAPSSETMGQKKRSCQSKKLFKPYGFFLRWPDNAIGV